MRTAGSRPWTWAARRALAAAAVLLFNGCHTPPRLPPIDTAQPGWRIEQGQALWRPGRKQTELAGEILLATGPDGRALLQFSKTPFPVATARQEGNAWSIAFGAGARAYGGHGEPVPRFVWFQVFRWRAGTPPYGGWERDSKSPDHLRLDRPATGERLELWLQP